jgi:hypothetical protein
MSARSWARIAENVINLNFKLNSSGASSRLTLAIIAIAIAANKPT